MAELELDTQSQGVTQTPAAGAVTFFFDSSDNAPSIKNPTGAFTKFATAASIAPIKQAFFFARDYGTLTAGPATATVAAAQATANRQAIQAAVDAAKAAGGGYAVVPGGNYHIDQTITIDSSSVVLMGLGAYGNTDAAGVAQTAFGSTLFWNNTGTGATVAMVDVISPSGASNAAVKRSGINGLNLQCAGNIGVGVRVRSIHWGILDDVYVINPSSIGFTFECLVTGSTLGEAADVTKGDFRNLRVRLLESPATATGFSLDGASNANTSNCTFQNIAVSCGLQQIALDFRNSDSNRLYDVAINQSNNGTVQPVRFRGGTASGLEARGNVIHMISAGGSSTGTRGVYVEGTETAGITQPSRANRIYAYSVENGEPLPVLGTGATLVYDITGAPQFTRRPLTFNATSAATAETIVAQWKVPAGFWQNGVILPIEFTSFVTAATTAGIATWRVRFGTAGTIAGDTANVSIAPTATIAANTPISFLNVAVGCTASAGTSATLYMAGGFLYGSTAVGPAVAAGSATAVTTTVNPTQELFVTLTVTLAGTGTSMANRFASLGNPILP
ncbi:hypothetical protein K8Z61_18580 [Nocardioides sp. TRM66260-LWL]|uniref:hypothetical protein n=1 Tax=Nocardioides sp. TRM66260-LWL TaxID=2874478 RepID=UPI001CC47C31|nr:hypothetical protein [Nocardioides sp. TRM66260-LWL]MBZ5736502.1 hypothetical protein [Nocardioides sp. TRM66260-LWL]